MTLIIPLRLEDIASHWLNDMALWGLFHLLHSTGALDIWRRAEGHCMSVVLDA